MVWNCQFLVKKSVHSTEYVVVPVNPLGALVTYVVRHTFSN
jgi:predicted CoA-binding protein